MFLIQRRALLAWIEMQLSTARHDEHLAWMKILSNIVNVMDLKAGDHETVERWLNALVRCITCLLTPAGKSAPTSTSYSFIQRRGLGLDAVLYIGAFILSLLASLPIRPSALAAAVSSAAKALERGEQSVDLSSGANHLRHISEDSMPLFSAQSLANSPVTPSTLRTWGKVVELLWRAAMVSGNGTLWCELTSRLLIWRSFVEQADSPVGEWARQEAVSLL